MRIELSGQNKKSKARPATRNSRSPHHYKTPPVPCTTPPRHGIPHSSTPFPLSFPHTRTKMLQADDAPTPAFPTTFRNGCCRRLSCLAITVKILGILIGLAYLTIDIIFSIDNDLIFPGTEKTAFKVIFDVISAVARGLTLYILCTCVNRAICKCGVRNKNNMYNTHNNRGTKPMESTTKTEKSIEMVGSMMSKVDDTSSNTPATAADQIKYQPPAVRIHTVALEVSMQDDFAQSMQARQRQTFGIGRDMSYKHKPKEGFELPKDRTSSVSSSSGSSGNGMLRLPSMSVAEAVAMGPSNKHSRFVQAHVVERELERLEQEMGEMRSFFEQLARQVENNNGTGGKAYRRKKTGHNQAASAALGDMETGNNFHKYDQAKIKQQEQVEIQERSMSLVKKKSMGLM